MQKTGEMEDCYQTTGLDFHFVCKARKAGHKDQVLEKGERRARHGQTEQAKAVHHHHGQEGSWCCSGSFSLASTSASFQLNTTCQQQSTLRCTCPYTLRGSCVQTTARPFSGIFVKRTNHLTSDCQAAHSGPPIGVHVRPTSQHRRHDDSSNFIFIFIGSTNIYVTKRHILRHIAPLLVPATGNSTLEEVA